MITRIVLTVSLWLIFVITGSSVLILLWLRLGLPPTIEWEVGVISLGSGALIALSAIFIATAVLDK